MLIAPVILGLLAGVGSYIGWWLTWGIAAGSLGIAILVGLAVFILALLGVAIIVFVTDI